MFSCVLNSFFNLFFSWEFVLFASALPYFGTAANWASRDVFPWNFCHTSTHERLKVLLGMSGYICLSRLKEEKEEKNWKKKNVTQGNSPLKSLNR